MWHSLSWSHCYQENFWNFYGLSHKCWEEIVIDVVKDNLKRRKRWDGEKSSTNFAAAVSEIWLSNGLDGKKGQGAIRWDKKQHFERPNWVYKDDARE